MILDWINVVASSGHCGSPCRRPQGKPSHNEAFLSSGHTMNDQTFDETECEKGKSLHTAFENWEKRMDNSEKHTLLNIWAFP